MHVPRPFRFLFAGLAAVAATTVSLAQQNWRWANSLPASIRWKDVAFGNNVYVAVGGDATIATSPDGATWTVRRMSTANMALNGVAFAGGKFVAVGGGAPTSISGGLIMTSTDGITWTINDTFAAANSAQLFDVINNGTLWVASASSSGGRFFTSTDAQTWTSVTAPGFTSPNTGCYGNGRFVFAANSDSVVTSTDGATWTASTVAANSFIFSAAFAGGKFVAVGRDSNFNATAYTSTDGATWTPSSAIPGGSGGVGLNSIATNGSTFVAAGSASQFYSSTDGVTWTQRTPNLPSAGRQLGAITEPFAAVAFANNQFFTLGGYGSIITSPDGTAWTRRSTGTVSDLGAVIHDGARFVASGAGGTILTSTDGATWTQLTTGSTSDFSKLAFNGTRYVAAGFSGILQSTNLTSWSAISGTTSDRYAALAYGNSRFVAAYSATLLGTRTSPDGVTWSSANNIASTGGTTSGLAFGNNVFVLTTGGGGGATKILSSTDGAAWTDRTPAGITNSTQVDSLAFGGGRFVALTFDKRSLTSTDGLTWTINTLPSSPTLSGVTYIGSQFIARSSLYGAQAYASTDGATWTALDNSLTTNLVFAATAVAGNTVVAVGAEGMILLGSVASTAVPGPTITTQPVAQNGVAGGSVTFSVAASGTGNTYQWRKDGVAIAGAANATLTLSALTAANAGSYTVVVTNPAGGSTTSTAAALTLVAASNAGRLINMSIRTNAGTGDNTLIVGIGLGGAGTSGTKAVLVRGVGPTLASFGVGGALADPVLTAYSGATVIAQNDDWAGGFDFASVGAFALAGNQPKDAAIYNAAIPLGSYSIQVTGKNNGTGVALAEIYDATPSASFAGATPRLVNVSARTQVGTGDNILIAGLVVGGSTSVRVLVRAVGPSLTAFGVGGVLADPKLELYSGATKTAENNDWSGTADLKSAFTSVGAFGFANDGSHDAALIATLQPGSYTAQISGVNSTTGVALVEVYELP